jgi:hypothetical protein
MQGLQRAGPACGLCASTAQGIGTTAARDLGGGLQVLHPAAVSSHPGRVGQAVVSIETLVQGAIIGQGHLGVGAST